MKRFIVSATISFSIIFGLQAHSNASETEAKIEQQMRVEALEYMEKLNELLSARKELIEIKLENNKEARLLLTYIANTNTTASPMAGFSRDSLAGVTERVGEMIRDILPALKNISLDNILFTVDQQVNRIQTILEKLETNYQNLRGAQQ